MHEYIGNDDKKRPKIYVVIGSNRSRKTITILEEAIEEAQKFNKTIFYVARTVKNAEEALTSIKQFAGENFKITTVFGKANICPLFSGEHKDYIIENAVTCGGCERKKPVTGEVKDGLSEIQIIDRSVLNSLWGTYPNNCPKYLSVEHAKLRTDKPAIVITTYNGVKFLDLKEQQVKDFIVIFDEARHLTEMCFELKKSLTDNKKSKSKHEKIVQDFIKEIRSIDTVFLDAYLRVLLQRNMGLLATYIEDSFYKYLALYVDRCTSMEFSELLKETDKRKKKNHPELSELEKQLYIEYRKFILKLRHLKNYPDIMKEKFPQEIFIKSVNRPVFDVPDILLGRIYEMLWREHRQNSNSERFRHLRQIMIFLDIITKLKDENNYLNFDIITDEDGSNEITLIIRRRIHNKESRELFEFFVKNADKIFLIDSTPLPSKYVPFWLGRKYDITVRKFKPQYKFRVVVENALKRKIDIWKFPVNSKRFIAILTGIQTKLDKEMYIFARSKDEKLNLEKSGIKNVFYARGVEGEGVQLRGYTGIAGFPMQNMYSEEYRKYDIARMIGETNPSYLGDEYRKVKALQELIQNTFRTAYYNEQSGSIWFNIKENAVQDALKIWGWLKDIEFIICSPYLRIEDKIKFLSKGLMEGKLPEVTSTEDRITNDIIRLLKQYPSGLGWTELTEKVKCNSKMLQEILGELLEDKIIIKNRDGSSCMGGRPKDIYKMNEV